MKKLIGLCMMMGLCLFQGTASAVLTSASVTPASATLAINRPASINLTWTLVASPTNGIPLAATSSEIVITDPGQDVIYGTIPRLLSRTITPGGSGLLTETAQIPRSVIQAMSRARDGNGNPLSAFVLLRNFTDDNFSIVSATVNLYLSGGSSASLLQIDRLALTFDDLSTVRLVPREETLKALLDIQFSGSGQLRGVWELATPASTLGEPIYTNLRLVRQALVGNQTTRIESPELPTGEVGVYLLRFRVTEPETGFEPVYIRYLVTNAKAVESPPLNVQPLTPGNGARGRGQGLAAGDLRETGRQRPRSTAGPGQRPGGKPQDARGRRSAGDRHAVDRRDEREPPVENGPGPFEIWSGLLVAGAGHRQ